MKVYYETIIEVISQLNVDEQQEDIKDLKEKCNKYDKDRVQEISGA